MLSPLWEYLYDIISNHLYMFPVPVNTCLESPIGDKQNVYISTGV